MPKGWDKQKMTLPFRKELTADELIRLRGSSDVVLDVIAALTRKAQQKEQEYLLSNPLRETTDRA